MDDGHTLRDRIIENLVTKTTVKQKVFDNTFSVFNQLKEILHEMSSELNDATEDILDKRIRIEYRDRGKFEAQFQIGDDVLIFNMHTDVFEFARQHQIWQNGYVSGDRENSYCGIINIYNFLADSFKYNRNEDEGYLIGRIFINHDMKYFVEGKRQNMVRYSDFGSKTIDKADLVGIIETAVNYSLDFDLLVPPYDKVKEICVEQLNTKFESSKIRTGKRLGYEFNTDDI